MQNNRKYSEPRGRLDFNGGKTGLGCMNCISEGWNLTNGKPYQLTRIINCRCFNHYSHCCGGNEYSPVMIYYER